MNNQHVSVIIPVLNEEQAIAKVIGDMPECVDRVIVVDNNSTDATAKVARQSGAVVVSESHAGYGPACLRGVAEAGRSDILAFVDGGCRDYPEDLVKLLKPVAYGRCDLAIGCRRDESAGSKGRKIHQHMGTSLACLMIRLIYGVRFEDLGPMRCITKKRLGQLKMRDKRFGWTTEMQLKALIHGMEIMQVPVRYRQRIGKSKISGTLSGSLMAGSDIFYWIFRLAFSRSR